MCAWLASNLTLVAHAVPREAGRQRLELQLSGGRIAGANYDTAGDVARQCKLANGRERTRRLLCGGRPIVGRAACALLLCVAKGGQCRALAAVAAEQCTVCSAAARK